MIYLDNSATTRPSAAVREAMDKAMDEGFFNPSALYAPALTVKKEMQLCRDLILRKLHCPEGTVVFTGCGTEADNLMILGTLSSLREGRVLYSAGEHPAVREACLRAGYVKAEEIPYNEKGMTDLEKLRDMLGPDVKMICVMQVNNETGAIQPLSEIAKLRDEMCPSALLHVDGVQGFMRVPFDMTACGADSYALSGHKIHAPKGIGALVMGKRCHVSARLPGGGQEKGLRSGTENTPGIAGLRAAIENYPGSDRMRECKAHLYELLREKLPQVIVNGPEPNESGAAPHILNVSLPPVRSETMLHALEGDGIYVGIGSACASNKQKVAGTLQKMHVKRENAESALRFSLCPDNTMEEMEQTAAAIEKHYALLSRYARR